MFLLGQLKALQLFILKSSKQNETNQKKNLMIFMTRMSNDTVANCERDDSREKNWSLKD